MRRRSSSDPGFRARVARAAIREHRWSDVQAGIVNADARQHGEESARWKVSQWMREIREQGSSGLGYRFVRSDGTGEAHAVLLTRYETCRVRDRAGAEHAAYRFRFADPNYVEGVDAGIDPDRDFWIYYLRDEKVLAFEPGYVRLCRSQGRMLQVLGRQLDSAEVQYLDVHLLDSPYAARVRELAGVRAAD
jgi:hypothetical protein